MAKKTTDFKNVSDIQLAGKIREFRQKIFETIKKRVIGNHAIIDGLLTAILARGHVLLIGVPGVGKTLLIKCIANLLGLEFNRIQFTPDLMPSDITGSEILEESKTGRRSFKFIKGPVFANIILADEINRTSPRTQSALLQAMEEQHVTVAGVGYDLNEPFFVLATQNPIEQEGTYPLPEAQLDRFMFSLNLDYPSQAEEIQIANLDTSLNNSPLPKIVKQEELIAYQNLVKRVPISDYLIEQIVNSVRKTRPTGENNQYLEYGAGPRASQYIVMAARAKALLTGDDAVNEEHIASVVKDVLRHRIIINFQAISEGLSSDDILNDLI